LIEQGFPPHIQLLCGNCHRAKTRHVQCH
jgi:hypothetical protein